MYNNVHGGVIVDLIRIGDKLLSREKLIRSIDRVLSLRASGLSQQDTASRVGVDRTFISRLESLAEVRKGGRVAVIGFPLVNKQDLEKACQKFGVDYSFIMTDAERWQFVESLSGVLLIDKVMEIIANLRDYEVVVMIGSDMRIRLAEALLGEAVIGVQIGESPINKDVFYPVEEFNHLILSIKGGLDQ